MKLLTRLLVVVVASSFLVAFVADASDLHYFRNMMLSIGQFFAVILFFMLPVFFLYGFIDGLRGRRAA